MAVSDGNNADFTPELSGYTGQGAFRFWCQKVLPLVYDDSLSYYELLNKVVKYLNNTIADVATMEGNIDNLLGAYEQLQDYVNHYFDNLDVQNEINNKLNSLVADGTMTRLLRPIIETDIPPIVRDWLNAQVTPTSPIVDASLTISGAAADAKVTGDIREALNHNWKSINFAISTDGYINNTDGSVVIPYDGWDFTINVNVSNLKQGYLIVVASGTGSGFNAFYDANHDFIKSFIFRADSTSYIPIPENAVTASLSWPEATVVRLYGSDEDVNIKWYYYDSTTLVSENIDLSVPKYTLNVPEGFTVSVEGHRVDGSVIASTQYLGSRDWYRSNRADYAKLYVHYEGTLEPNNPGLTEITFKPKKSYDKIDFLRVMAFNVGLWHNGVTPLPEAEAEEYGHRFRKFLGNVDPDIIGLLEAPYYVGGENSGVTSSNLLAFKTPYLESYTTQVRAAAKDAILAAETLTFTSGSGRPIVKFKYKIGGVYVTFFLTHLSIEANLTGPRQLDLAQLANLMAQEEYAVLMGDLNTYNMDEIYNFFGSYKIANGGIFGKMDTWRNHTSWPNNAIDNIITTTNISIQMVDVPDVDFSDHWPIIADLSVYY